MCDNGMCVVYSVVCVCVSCSPFHWLTSIVFYRGYVCVCVCVCIGWRRTVQHSGRWSDRRVVYRRRGRAVPRQPATAAAAGPGNCAQLLVPSSFTVLRHSVQGHGCHMVVTWLSHGLGVVF